MGGDITQSQKGKSKRKLNQTIEQSSGSSKTTFRSLEKVHSFYENKLGFYRQWHIDPRSSKVHFLILGLFITLSIVTAALVLPSSPDRTRAGAAYYVATTGNDTSGNGSSSSPWKTIQKAVNTVSPGDTINVRAGTYNERVVANKTGTSSSPIIIQGYQQERPVVSQGFELSGSYVTVKQFEITPGSTSSTHVALSGSNNIADDIYAHDLQQSSIKKVFGIGGSNNTVQGSRVENWASYANLLTPAVTVSNGTLKTTKFSGVSSFRIAEFDNNSVGEGNEFIGPNEDGVVFIEGSNVIFKNNLLYKTGRRVGSGVHTDPLGIEKTSASGNLHDVVVDGNIFSGPPSPWTEPADGNRQWEGPPFYIFFFGMNTPVYSNITIKNNIFLPGADRAMDQNLGPESVSGINNIYNNIFLLGNSQLEGSTWRWKNNIYYGGSTNYSVHNPAAADYNLWANISKDSKDGSHSITSSQSLSQLFVNPTMTAATRYGLDADWHLKSGSAAIGAGVGPSADSYVPTVDRGGDTRSGAATDIGPYLFSTGGTPPPSSGSTPTTGDVYVTKSGNDTTGDGTAGKPYFTLSKAVSIVVPGKTINVSAGTYNERVTIPSSKSGSSGNTTKLVANGTVIVSQGFVVQANYAELTGFEITGGYQTGNDYIGQVHVTGSNNTFKNFNIHDVLRSAFSFHPSSSNCTIDGFTIDTTNSGSGFMLSDSERGAGTVPYGTQYTKNYGANNITIKNGTISHYGGTAAINVYGDNHLIENVTIVGGPSGAPNDGMKDGDGIRVNYSSGTVIRNAVIHDLWEWYTSVHHVDCIQMYIEVYDLLIENSKLGTWEANPGSTIPTTPGPTQIMMVGTVYANSHIDFEMRNSLILGQTGTGASIVTATQSGASIDVTLINNTFWSSYPSLNSTRSAKLRNNVFRSFYIYPTNKSGIDSDYNAFFWLPSQGQTNLSPYEGAHSVGKIYADRLSTNAFSEYDITSASDWGLDNNWSPSGASSLLYNRGIGPDSDSSIPTKDISGNQRSGSTTSIGAYEPASSGGGGTPPPPASDTENPTVSLASPANSAVLSGNTAISAQANDNVGVTKVEFLVDGNVVSTDTSSPYSYSWDTSSVVDGTHSVSAKAYDEAGNSASTSSASVKVDNNAPSVTLTGPVSGSSVAGSTTLSAVASDLGTGVQKVEFYVDGVKLGQDTTQPYSYSWNTASYSAGNHTLYAKAFDNAGRSTDSANSAVNIGVSLMNSTISADSPAVDVPGEITVKLTLKDVNGNFVSNHNIQFSSSQGALDVLTPAAVVTNSQGVAQTVVSTVFPHASTITAFDQTASIGIKSIGITFTNPSDTTPPTVSIISPASGATVSGNITISADASDNFGIDKVEFYLDSTLIDSDASNPYTVSWHSALVPNGAHTVKAKAYDGSGNLNTATVDITVSNQEPFCGSLTASATRTKVMAVAGSYSTITVKAQDILGDNMYGKTVAVSGTREGDILTPDSSHTDTSGIITYIFKSKSVGETALTFTVDGKEAKIYIMVTKSGDVNGDAKVDLTDLAFLMSRWNQSTTNADYADVNCSGKVDTADLAVLMANWGN